MEDVSCDYCGSPQHSYVTRQTDLLHNTTIEYFQIVQCTNCGLNYTNPRPTADEIGQFYSSQYSFYGADTRFRALFRKMTSWLVNSPLGFVFDVIPRVGRRLAVSVKPKLLDPVRNHYQKGGRGVFLDIGCGSGLSAHYWGEAGSLNEYQHLTSVAGVEVSDSARKHLEDRGILVWKDLSSVPADLKFSVIRMNWSLEHVHSPSEYFSFISSRLESNGLAIIAVPNFEGLIYKLSKDCVELPIHLYHFRAKDIVNYANRYKLNVSTFCTYSYPQMFKFAAQLGLLPEQFFKNMNISEAKHFQYILNKFDAIGYGNDMIFTLKKN